MKIKQNSFEFSELFDLFLWTFENYPDERKDSLFVRDDLSLDICSDSETVGSERTVLSSDVINKYRSFFRADDERDITAIYNTFLIDSLIMEENLKLSHFWSGTVFDCKIKNKPLRPGINYSLEILLDNYSGMYEDDEVVVIGNKIMSDFSELMGGDDETEKALMTLFVFEHKPEMKIELDEEDAFYFELDAGNPDLDALRSKVKTNLLKAYRRHVPKNIKRLLFPVFVGLRFYSLLGLDAIKEPGDLHPWERNVH